jgi:TRAP-type C4-dicarboxylate transport system substrate-binding protein
MKSALLAIVSTVAAILSSIHAAGALELRVLSSWDNSYPIRSILLEEFVKRVEAASKRDLTFSISGPETVPPFEQLQPVASGAFQILVTHGAYHIGTSSMLIGTEGFTGDLAKWRGAGVRDVMDEHYQRIGLKLLALPRSPEGTAFHILLREPVSATGDLQGRKIRGTQNYAGVFKLLGASPVVLPPSDIYSSLEKGVINGAAWPVLGIRAARWNEVAKYMLRPSFGTVSYPMLVNLSTWRRLTDGQRKILTEEADKIEDFWAGEWNRLAREEQDALLASGSQLTEMGKDQQSRLLASWAQGSWEVAMTRNPKEVAEFREWAKGKGLSQ